MSDSLPVALLWHHHQPQYRDLAQRNARGALRLPWVRLHALRDYYGMAALVSGYPDLHVTFNFTPVLLEQLEAYCVEAVTDGALELTLTPAERLTSGQRQTLSERFFDADWHHQIYPHRRFTQLLRQGLDGDLSRTSDWRDLQMWFNLAWFAEEFRNGEVDLCTDERVSVARFVQQGEGFSALDIEEMVHEQYKVLRAVIPLHARLQAEGRIEISTSPYAHPILPLLIDTDRSIGPAPRTQRDSIVPKMREVSSRWRWSAIRAYLVGSRVASGLPRVPCHRPCWTWPLSTGFSGWPLTRESSRVPVARGIGPPTSAFAHRSIVRMGTTGRSPCS